jgi:hypothetical protein
LHGAINLKARAAATMTPAPDVGTSYTRLHISPLDPDLLPVVLSTALLPKARNISYHDILTFPEKRYGFLDLPAEDAAKLRKKLNGAVLKGQKIRVEQAKPEYRPEPLGDAAMAGEKVSKKKDRKVDKADKSKKRKRETEEIPGIELEPGRKVKRGWTVAEESKPRKDKDKREKSKKDKKERRETKSKYTEHPECLLKTVLPQGASDTGEVGDEDGKKKRKKSKSKEVVVHEFAKTTKFPTFLKDTASSSAKGRGDVEFVDGKGWVDGDGNIVETVQTRSSFSKAKMTALPEKSPAKPPSDKVHQDSSNSEESPNGSASESGSESEDEEEAQESDDRGAETTTSSSRVLNAPAKPVSTPTSILKTDTARPRSSSSAKGLSIKIPPATPGAPKVHPLEALYKRPRQTEGSPAKEAGPESEPFSFFADGDVEEDEAGEVRLQVPMTPFSRQDFETRGIRSAAPTPDTAHPSRMSKFWAPDDADDIEEANEDQEDDDADEPADAEMRDGQEDGDVEEAGGSEQPASDFQKWFWEHRGDLNRSWKKRRKTAAKEKRYRENRARAERAI